MLLEGPSSDFQISIPELGVIEARTQPIVVLNLEQLPRAHRGAEAPLPVPPGSTTRRWTGSSRSCACHRAPDLDEGLARRLVEIVHMIRGLLDLKKAALHRGVDRLGAGRCC